MKVSKLTIFQKIEKAFKSKAAKKIETYNSKDQKFQETLELTNYRYTLDFDNISSNILSTTLDLNNKEEIIERSFILKKTREASMYLLTHSASRQASFVNNYDGKDNHCLSYFHFYIRDNNLYLNVYVRSQNYDTNFIFDAITFLLACQLMKEILVHDFIFKKALIKVHTMSLHRVIKSLKRKK